VRKLLRPRTRVWATIAQGVSYSQMLRACSFISRSIALMAALRTENSVFSRWVRRFRSRVGER
jgi:hypothetical protein